MASPQCEAGFTKIANEIMEALSKIRIPGEPYQILNVIFRKTYGWGKKQDRISLSQFVELTGLKKPSIVRAIRWLFTKKIIHVYNNDNGFIHVYEFNKDYTQWQPLSKKITFTKKLMSVYKKDNESFTIMSTTKETIQKKLLQKKKPPIIPHWINAETWKDFLEHRKKLKPAMTLRAQELMIKKLENLKKEGHDPNNLLNESIMNGWKSVFPPKEAQNGQARATTGKRASIGKTQGSTPYSDGQPYPVDHIITPDDSES